MAKKRGWFDLVKRIFGIDSKTKQEKKERRKRWLVGRLKVKLAPVLPAPSPLTAKTLREAEQEQNMHALALAVATAAAAEAAVAAAQAAVEVVRLTGTPLSHHDTNENAAIKIQNAFRGYLARRALRALKGLVRLQALVRGRAVRRQTAVTLKNLQSLVKIQSQVRASRVRMADDNQTSESKEQVNLKTKELRSMNAKGNEKIWDSSSLRKEEINAILTSRHEAALKRERAMQYASLHQGRRNARRHTISSENALEPDELNRRWSWLEQWVETQPWVKDISENCPVPRPDLKNITHDQQQFIRDSLPCFVSENADQVEARPIMRRSFNRSRRSSIRDDESFSSSPSFPSYMAFTESAKARSRSMSTPKQRIGSTTEIFPDHCIPYTSKLLSPFPSICSEAGVGKTSKFPVQPQRSPRVKGSSGPLKSNRSSDYHSLDSQCSLLIWDRVGSAR